MQTELIEIAAPGGNTLRAIFTDGDGSGRATLMLHGFERASSTEPKWKRLADALALEGVASLRLDYSGCGLSDGDLSKNTVASYAKEAHLALSLLQHRGFTSIAIAAHSLSGCVVASLSEADRAILQKIVLIAPALNQKEVLRYLFTRSVMKRKEHGVRVTWENFRAHLDEEAFQADCQRADKMTRANFFGAGYFLENMERDYAPMMVPLLPRTLLVYGDEDSTVPYESLSIKFPNEVIVKRGDHDLERPDMIPQWLPKIVQFIAG